MTTDMDLSGSDICRVCRSEGLTDRPLFHPCICTGSIKWIHQECLMQWMRYSRKEYCELCGHRFSFTPIYSPDMPRRLPIRVVAGGLLSSVGTAVKYWLHYTLVALAWLGVVPLAAYRIYRCLFTGSLDSILTLPLDMLSPDNIAADVFRGCFVVTCTLFAFIGLVWLREQVFHGGGPDWLELGDNNNGAANHVPEAAVFQPDVVNEPVENENAQPNIPADEPINNEVPPNAPLEEPEPEVVANGDEANWNPMEWDRAAEELTWEHLLGLDGSLVFLEHVFWVISINTLFIIVFAFCPYHIGRMTIETLGIMKPGSGLLHFNGLITTLLGYCIIGIFLIELHSAAKLLGLIRPRRILGLCYIYVKVSLLSVVEIGVLPLICGCWLDICSLPMFDASLKGRLASFKIAPGTSLFIHWLVGMVYVYYFASFILLLREVLRPGVLWFLRNLNDPDFSPIQEMIHMSILRHTRRLLASTVIFGTAVLLMLWIPVRILRSAWPSFLPYMVAVHGDAQINELSLELLLLQVILPALLEQSHTRIWLKALMRAWCKGVSWLLDLRSYLLGDDDEGAEGGDNGGVAAPPQPAAAPPAALDPAAGLGAAHQALLHRDDPVGFQPYTRPRFFVIRMIGLLILVAISLILASLVALTVPVWLGRHGMSLWLVGGPPNTAVTAATTKVNNGKVQGRVHELYTAACGMYLCWLGARAMALLVSWLPQGRAAIMAKIKQWISVGAACVLSAVLLLGVIPMLFGLLLEFVVVMPLRVPLEQTPNVFLWQDWALGVLYTKIACAVTMMGPDWSLRRAIEKAYRDGIREIDIVFIACDLAAPVITCFGLALAVPYIVSHSIAPLFITNNHTLTLVTRRIYPFLLLICLIGAIIVFQIKQFKKLYEHIKNDKYLVGQRLVNYDHRRHKNQTVATTTSSNN